MVVCVGDVHTLSCYSDSLWQLDLAFSLASASPCTQVPALDLTTDRDLRRPRHDMHHARELLLLSCRTWRQQQDHRLREPRGLHELSEPHFNFTPRRSLLELDRQAFSRSQFGHTLLVSSYGQVGLCTKKRHVA